MDRLEFISTVALFQGLSDQELASLNRAAVEKSYAPGEYLTQELEEAGAIFLVREGRVKLTKVSYNGKEQTIQFYSPGDLIGLFTLFTGSPFPASAVALENSRALMFSSKTLENAARQAPSLMVNLFFALAMRMNECIRTVDFLALKEIPQRLASFLLLSLDKAGTGNILYLPFSQRELAKVLGTTPETLCRVCARLVSQNIITVKGRKIIVTDRTRLEEVSQEAE